MQTDMLSRYDLWIAAARPKTLLAAVGPLMMGTAMAAHDGFLHLPSSLVCLISVLLIQVGTNLSNDYYDGIRGADNGSRQGPIRVTHSNLISKKSVRNAFIICFSLAALTGSYLASRAGVPVMIILAISILAGYFYTGGPHPYGYMGLGDIFVFIFFGYVAVGLMYYVQALTINTTVILSGTGPGLLSMALLTVNNLRDRHTDSIAGKKTLAVRFGARFTRFEYLFAVTGSIVSAVLTAFVSDGHLLIIGVSGLAPLFIPLIIKVFTFNDGRQLNDVLDATAKLLMAYCVIFSIGWIV